MIKQTMLFAPGVLRSAQPKHGRGLHGPRRGLHGPRWGLHGPGQGLHGPRLGTARSRLGTAWSPRGDCICISAQGLWFQLSPAPWSALGPWNPWPV